MQLLVTSAVVRRLGVMPALLLTPLCLATGAGIALLGAGALPGVLLVKGIDGGLRYSIHRVSGELVYLPIPAATRQRAKPLIDGALARVVQTATGAGLLALSGTPLARPQPLAALVASLALVWLVAAMTTRRPYLRLLRGVVSAGSLQDVEAAEPIDLETAQLLVQRLASEDPAEVEGAMVALARRDRSGLVPALVLLHHDERVLVRALEMFGSSDRGDWYAQARRLVEHPSEAVRVAAARALARHEQLDASSLSADIGLRARGYAAVRMALRDESTSVLDHVAVRDLLARPDGEKELAERGMLAAIADARPSSRLWPLLRALAALRAPSRERSELFAAAAARQRDEEVLPQLVALLAARDGREAVRTALVSFAEPAMRHVWRTLRDPARPRRLRLHMAKTLARFGTKAAADLLIEEIEHETDVLVRTKAIHALRWLVSEHRMSLDRARIEALAARDLEEHFRRLAILDVAGSCPTGGAIVDELLPELLEEEAAQSLERAFNLLQVAHPHQGVHHALLAHRSGEPYVRANAAELLDALLHRRDQGRLRDLFQLATDDRPAPLRLRKARALVRGLVETRIEAIEALVASDDRILAELGRRWERAEPVRFESVVVRRAAGGG
jgi:AAA family ATP:ADP antiporter